MRRNFALPLCLLLSSPAWAQSTIYDLSGSTADSWGQVCDLVGDTDGDGQAEIMIGAWRDDPNGLNDAGNVFVYDGATGAIAFDAPGTGAGDHMGFGSSSAGDVNGDGFFDLCAAADEDNVPGVGSNAGSARIVSGIDGSTLFTVTGDSGSDLFGWSTAAAGDIDGDGYDDVLIGALLDEGGGSPQNAGSITAVSGLTGTVIHKIYGPALNGQMGSHVGGVGDVNDDGFADMGAVRGNQVRVYSGFDGSLLYTLFFASGGLKVSGGVDLNGDGADEVIVGSPNAAGGRGQVHVYNGRTGLNLISFTGDNVGDALGSGVAGGGDIDGDGYEDVVGGMSGFDAGGNNRGGIRAYSGRTGLVIGTVGGNANGHLIGQDVGAGHDVDGDGFPDAVGCATSARAKVVSFRPERLNPFGTGTPGCAGSQPLLANGSPDLGDAGFELHTSNTSPGLPAVLSLAGAPDIPGTPVLGVLVHVNLAGPIVPIVTPPADAIGSLVIPLPLPNDPTLAGGILVAQIASLWPAPGCGTPISTSRGLAMTLQ